MSIEAIELLPLPLGPAAVRNVSPSLLWAIKLRMHREELSPTFAGEDRNWIKDVAYVVGEALTRAAAALPDRVMEEAPLLENIGLYHFGFNSERTSDD